MAYSWIKLPLDFFDQPDQVIVGPRASALYLRLLCLAERQGSVSLPARYMAATYLAATLRLPADEVEEDLRALANARLIDESEISTTLAQTWRPEPATSTERVRAHRERERERERNETLHDETAATQRNGETHKIRLDKTRKDKKKAPPEAAVLVAVYLYNAIRSHKPDFERSRSQIESWARAIPRKYHDQPDRLHAAIDYAHRSEKGAFWRANILSTSKLLAKLDTLEIQMAKFKLADGGDWMSKLQEPDGSPMLPIEESLARIRRPAT